MRIAFVLFKILPHGGLTRDLVKIATRCKDRGHDVKVFAHRAEGERPAGLETVLLPGSGLRSHVRQRRFAHRLQRHLAEHPVDLVVGMNKLPGLDVYYAGDSCFEAKARDQRPWFYRLTSRYRHFADFERAVFDEHGRTRVLTIAPNQAATFRAYYATPLDRFHELPPGIESDRACAADGQAVALRQRMGVEDGESMLLFVGSGFVKKGLERVLEGVSALPAPIRSRVRLFVLGADKSGRFERRAQRLGIGASVRFVGGRDDVPAWLRAADGLVLPAHDEAGGMVILESAIAGVPVLVTGNCGYSPYIDRAKAGIVTDVPFSQEQFNADLERLLTSDERPDWSRGGLELAKDPHLYAMADRAVELLESFATASEPPLVAFCVDRYLLADPACRSLVPTAQACARLGMRVRVYARDWQGAEPSGVELIRVPVAALGRAKRHERYRRWVGAALESAAANWVVSYDERSGDDVRAFGTGIDDDAADLPPGIDDEPTASSPDRATRISTARDALRDEYGFGPDPIVFGMVGGDLVGHGFERLLVGIARLPDNLRDRCRVLALGDLARPFFSVIGALELESSVRVVGGLPPRDAIEVADVFVDLAYTPSSNGWIFDALAAGRGVVTHRGVAEARLVDDAQAGVVLSWPVRQAELNRTLEDVVSSAHTRARWSSNGAGYCADPRHYGQAKLLAEIIAARAWRNNGYAQAVSA